MKKTILALVLGFAYATSAQAGWIKLDITLDRGTSVSINSDISRNGQIVTYWSQFVFSDGTVETEKDEVNCANKMTRMTHKTGYYPSGNVKYSNTISDASWRHIVPDTAGEEIFTYICKK